MNTYTGKFIDGSANPIDGWRGISPLFTVNQKNQTVLLGTVFFISRNGLMLTAKHCLFDNSGNRYRTLFIAQFLREDKYLIRPIFKAYWNNSDVAALLPNHARSKITGEDLFNPVPILSTNRPKPGEIIASFGYPTTIISDTSNKVTLDIYESWHFGDIEDYHPEGSSILRNACYQTSMFIKGGSSGGPVFNSSKRDFAINSTGCDVMEGMKPYSLLTPIELSFDIMVDGISGEKYSIRELIDLKQVFLEN